ncbi:DUF11 domain-containing protein [bacterium]|nr:DUF11 domain-containing protein [bacterium]
MDVERITTTPADAEDTVSYSVIFTNTGTSVAYNVLFTDTLPTDLTLDLGSMNIVLGGGATGSTDNSSGNTVAFSVDAIPVNGTVTVTYDATLNLDVTPGQQIDNQADVTYTSLPGTGTTGTTGNPTGSNTPGGSGDNDGERDGSGGVNDYSDSDPASFTAADPGVVKQIDGTSAAHTANPDVTIGEVITYALTVTLPEGLTPSLVITDDLPTGLSYVVGSVAVDSSGFNGTLPTPSITATGGSGDDVIVTFGNITVTADNDTGNNSFIVRLQALVLDEVGNVGLPPSQTDLINNAVIRVGNNPEIPTNPVTVVEPQMVITKTLTPAQAAANDTITIELVVQNTGESTAFDVIIEDPLPMITFTNISEVSTPAGFTFSTVDMSPDTLVRYTGGDIPVGEQRIFTFTAQLTTAVNAGDVYTNVATVTQATTLPGVDPNERDEPDVDDQDDVTVVAPDLTLTKDDGITVLEPGQTTVYTLTVGNVGTSPATGVVISDTVPTGTTFDAAGSSAGWSCADNAPAGTVCTYAVGVLNLRSPLDVFFAVTVDLPLAASVTSIVNVALVADDGSQGDDPTPSNNTDDDIDQVTVGALGNYVWEDVDFDGLQGGSENGIDGVTVNLLNSNGDFITSTVTSGGGVYNFGGLGSGGYIVEFVLPNGYLFTQKDAGAEDIDSDADTSTGRTDIVSLGQGETNNDIDAGLNLAASLGDRVWDDLDADGIQDGGEPGIPGVVITLSNGLTTTTDANGIYTFTNLIPGVYTVTVDVPAGYVVSPPNEGADDPETPDPKDPTITVVIGTPRVVISKQIVGSTQVRLGDALTYTIRITNTGNTVLTMVPLTDTFTTDYLDFVSAAPVPDVVDESAGFAYWADLTSAFGNLLPGDSFTVNTVMKATAVTPEGVSASNRATVANVTDEFDQTPPDGEVKGGAEIDISPYLILTKSRIGSEVVEVGQEITYSIRITNVGDTVIVTLPLSDSYDSQVLTFVRSQPAPTQMHPGLVEWADLTSQFGDLALTASIEVLTVFTASRPISNTVNMAMVVNAVDEVGNLINAEDSATVTVASPAAVTLLSFTAMPEGNALRVSWVTGIEIDSWGFHLWRSETGRPEGAVRVTGQMIPARGSATQGASYTHLDTGVVPGVLYHYWLEETELNGTLLRYGPIVGVLMSAGENVQLIPRVYLPFVNAP